MRDLKTRDELAAAKEYAEMIVDTVRESLLVLTKDLCVRSANRSFYDTFQVSPEETEGRLVYELGNGQWDIPELRRLLEEILPERKIMNDFEVAHHFEGIGHRVMLLNARQLDHHQLILLAIEDATERRQSERRLRESEERFRLLVDNAKEYAIFILDAENRIALWSPGAERILGWSEEEVLGAPGEIIFTPEDCEEGVPAREIGRARAHGSALDDRWHVRKDGSRFWANGIMVALRDDGNAADRSRIHGFAKILRDNTEQKRAEEALRHSEARYRTLFEAIDEGFCIAKVLFDASGEPVDYRFLETNPAFERQTGLHDVAGRRMRELAPSHEEHWFETYGRIALTGEPERFTNEAKHLDNRWYDVYAFRVGRPEERTVAMLFNDVTARKRAEEALRQLNETLEARIEERTRQVRRLASTLTQAEQAERRRISQVLHDDLQQLLYGIQIKVSMMHRDAGGAGHRQLAEAAQEIGAWLEQAITTTRQLTVDLSPPVLKEEGLMDALGWLVLQMEEMYGLEVDLKAAHAFRLPDEDMRVLLFQIVRELLFNVVKHAGTGRATVELHQVDGHLVVRVSDEGRGFDVEEAARLAGHGDGFGLFSVRERLSLFGGRLEIDSAPGEGTRVTVHVPELLKPSPGPAG